MVNIWIGLCESKGGFNWAWDHCIFVTGDITSILVIYLLFHRTYLVGFHWLGCVFFSRGKVFPPHLLSNQYLSPPWSSLQFHHNRDLSFHTSWNTHCFATRSADSAMLHLFLLSFSECVLFFSGKFLDHLSCCLCLMFQCEGCGSSWGNCKRTDWLISVLFYSTLFLTDLAHVQCFIYSVHEFDITACFYVCFSEMLVKEKYPYLIRLYYFSAVLNTC